MDLVIAANETDNLVQQLTFHNPLPPDMLGSGGWSKSCPRGPTLLRPTGIR